MYVVYMLVLKLVEPNVGSLLKVTCKFPPAQYYPVSKLRHIGTGCCGVFADHLTLYPKCLSSVFGPDLWDGVFEPVNLQATSVRDLWNKDVNMHLPHTFSYVLSFLITKGGLEPNLLGNVLVQYIGIQVKCNTKILLFLNQTQRYSF